MSTHTPLSNAGFISEILSAPQTESPAPRLKTFAEARNAARQCHKAICHDIAITPACISSINRLIDQQVIKAENAVGSQHSLGDVQPLGVLASGVTTHTLNSFQASAEGARAALNTLCRLATMVTHARGDLNRLDNETLQDLRAFNQVRGQAEAHLRTIGIDSIYGPNSDNAPQNKDADALLHLNACRLNSSGLTLIKNILAEREHATTQNAGVSR